MTFIFALIIVVAFVVSAFALEITMYSIERREARVRWMFIYTRSVTLAASTAVLALILYIALAPPALFV